MGFSLIKVFKLSCSTFQLVNYTPLLLNQAPLQSWPRICTIRGRGRDCVFWRYPKIKPWEPRWILYGQRPDKGESPRSSSRALLSLQHRAAGRAASGSREGAPAGGAGWDPNLRSYAAEGRGRGEHIPTCPAVEGGKAGGQRPRYLTQGQLLL